METYKMWIGDEWVDADSGKTLLTHNPATGEVVAQVPEAGRSDVDHIGFTGSSEVGKAIIAASSQTVKTLMMELGGKNPAIILEDADVTATAEELCMIAFQNVGQNCAQPSRILVHEKISDRKGTHN